MMKLFSATLTLLAIIASSTVLAVAPPPAISAKGYLLIDMNSGRIIAEQNATTALEPASLTKIMTAHVVFDELKAGRITLADQVLISEKAWKMGGSRMFIEVNKRVSVEQLLKGLIIQSGNDAAVALAEHVAGSEEAFASLMNKEAEKLGMTNSHFVNASGFPADNHYTTAHDIAKVTMATIRDFPEFYAWYAEKEFTYNDIKQSNRNRLLWHDESVDGVKTGHTEAAGYCLVASAERNNMRLVSVIMGTSSDDSRSEESRKLLNYGFRFFVTTNLFSSDKPLKQLKVWKGESDSVIVGVTKPVQVTIPRDAKERIKANMLVDGPIEAPITRGQRIGTISVTLDGESLSEIPLVALDNVQEGGFFGNLKDSLLLMLE